MSWSGDQDRSAKALNRTANVNAQKKSDCAAVPVNQPNKEEQSSTEAGEGRAQTGENIVPSRMRPTQSGKSTSQGLHGVRQAARERKQERFSALLHHLSVGLLRESLYALQRQASPGIDGVTGQEYVTGLEGKFGGARCSPTVSDRRGMSSSHASRAALDWAGPIGRVVSTVAYTLGEPTFYG